VENFLVFIFLQDRESSERLPAGRQVSSWDEAKYNKAPEGRLKRSIKKTNGRDPWFFIATTRLLIQQVVLDFALEFLVFRFEFLVWASFVTQNRLK